MDPGGFDKTPPKKKLPFVILNPLDQSAEEWAFLQEDALSCRERKHFSAANMRFPAEKKKTFSRRKMRFPAEKCGLKEALCRKR